MQALLVAEGSHGDVLPIVGLARALQRRGADVRLLANERFRAVAGANGVDFLAFGDEEVYRANTLNPDLAHPRKSTLVISRNVFADFPQKFAQLLELAETCREPTILVGTSFSCALRCLAEVRGWPTVVVHMAPSLFRSAYEPAQMTSRAVPPLPVWANRLLWWSVDTVLVDPMFTRPFNRHRHQIGLPPVKRMLHRWVHDVDITIGLFPEWFAGRPADWPQDAVLAGFPLFDAGASDVGLRTDLLDFLDAGSAPVVFSVGTPFATMRPFYTAAADACEDLGLRGLLVTSHPENYPRAVHRDVMVVPWAPFSHLFPRAAAVVHHGGIGTLSQALAAGVPQIVCPIAYDQHDNAARVEKLGVALTLAHPNRAHADAIKKRLEQLVQGGFRDRAKQVATWLMPRVDALDSAAEAIIDRAGSYSTKT